MLVQYLHVPIVWQFWKSERPGAHSACSALYKDFFTFTTHIIWKDDPYLIKYKTAYNISKDISLYVLFIYIMRVCYNKIFRR